MGRSVRIVSAKIIENISHATEMETYSPHCGIHFIQRDSIYLAAVFHNEEPSISLLVLSLLEHVYAILRRYFSVPLSESVLQVNFDALYLILDEIFVGGCPFSLELNNIESTVVTPAASGLVNKLASAVSGNKAGNNSLTGISAEIWWRRSGVFHASNEFYLDIVDRVNCIVSSSGQLVSGSISGRIDANSKLSGVPELLLSLKTPNLFQSSNISFHPCVRIARWKRDAKLSFVPPDGTFTLAEYCVFDKSLAVLPFHVKIANDDSSHISVTLNPKLSFIEKVSPIIEGVTITVKMPAGVSGATLLTDTGSAWFRNQTIHWNIGKLGAPVKLEGSLSGKSLDGLRTCASVEFLVRGWAASAIKVDCVELSGIDYKPYKGCRYSTAAGRIDLRV